MNREELIKFLKDNLRIEADTVNECGLEGYDLLTIDLYLDNERISTTHTYTGSVPL